MHLVVTCSMLNQLWPNSNASWDNLIVTEVTLSMLNQSFSLSAIVMHLGVLIVTVVTLPVLNQLFSSGAIVLHLGVTNCYWSNLISCSVLSQSLTEAHSNASWGPGVT